MNQVVALESPAAPPAPRDALPGLPVRLALAVVPFLTLGVLGVVPSLVLALRRGGRADWLAAVGFTAVTVGWWFQIGLSPEDTHGAQFALDVLLLFGSTIGAAAHCLAVRPAKQQVGDDKVLLGEDPSGEDPSGEDRSGEDPSGKVLLSKDPSGQDQSEQDPSGQDQSEQGR
ncbi:hypothetical protein ACFV9D_06940 [Streptomyces sp. NPDC059875]|uniref:hypothetical protein n=1 Tax=unclassified Streptomyces TaxID=2593676 RepID=UPI00365BE4BA